MKTNLTFKFTIVLLSSAIVFAGTLTVSTDKPVYELGEPIHITIIASPPPMTLQFPTSCTAYYTMDWGDYDSSAGIVCAYVITELFLPHTWNETHNMSAYTPGIGTHYVTAYLYPPWTDYFPSNTAVFTVSLPRPDMQLIHPNGGQIYPAGSTINIQWTDMDPDLYDIEYSVDNGSNWDIIDTDVTGTFYPWTTPSEIHSDLCRIRISKPAYAESVTSENVFTVFQCSQPPAGDRNNDCYINHYELSFLANFWLHSECGEGNGWCEGTDQDQSGTVGIGDLASFLDSWLDCTNSLDPSCL